MVGGHVIGGAAIWQLYSAFVVQLLAYVTERKVKIVVFCPVCREKLAVKMIDFCSQNGVEISL